MTLREKPIYLSTDVYRALWIIGKSMEAKNDSMQIRTVSPDELADLTLRDALAKNFPQVWEHLKREDKAQKELIESIKK